MKRTHNRLLTDDELRPQLEARDVISFVGEPVSLEEMERQIERLGFGDLYVVSASQGLHTSAAKINLRPEAMQCQPTRTFKTRASGSYQLEFYDKTHHRDVVLGSVPDGHLSR